jgi:hypothetical protein
MLTVKEVKQAIGHYADQVSRNKDGMIVIRRGYFYTHGTTAESFMLHMTERLNSTGLSYDVVDYYNFRSAFNGGASLARSSHFGVVIKAKE